MRAESRRGVALLEALLALVLLTTAGLAWTALASQASFTLEQSRERELEMVAASAILARVEALAAPELEAMAGRRRIDGRTVRVSRVMPTLFRVEVAVAEDRDEWLETHVYRPREPHDAT